MDVVVPLLRTVVAVAAVVGLLWWAGRRLAGRAPSGAGLAGSGLGGPRPALRRPAGGTGLRGMLAAATARLGERRPAPQRALRVVERATLSPRASVALVELGGRRLLLGVGEQGITVLDRSDVPVVTDVPAVDADVEPDLVPEAQANSVADFETILRESLGTPDGARERVELR